MANTLTQLIPDLYAAMDTVSRELVGFVPSVTIDANASRAALNQTVRSFVAPAASASDITPAVTPPNDGDQALGNKTIAITKSRRVPFRWNGEEQLALGPSPAAVRQEQIAQAMRTLVNEIEADLAGLHIYASRAYGTAGTAPFGTAGDYSDAANVRKILMDNGAPQTNISLVLNTAAGANLRGKQVSAASRDDSLVRRGVLLDVHGMALRESAQVKTPTAGTMANATTNNAGYAVGATVITLATAGTGVVAAGDVVSFAGDANKYVVSAVSFAGANPAAGDTITLAAPGLRVAMSAAAKAITVTATAARNMAFASSAIVLAQRLPALPDGRDMATDRTVVTDPISGLTFEVAEYLQYRQVQYEVSAAWGVSMIKPEHAAILLG